MCPSLNLSLWLVGGRDSPHPGPGHVFTPRLLLVKAPPKPCGLRVEEGKGVLILEEEGIKSDLMQPTDIY